MRATASDWDRGKHFNPLILCLTIKPHFDKTVPSEIQSSKLIFWGFSSPVISSIHWLSRNSKRRSLFEMKYLQKNTFEFDVILPVVSSRWFPSRVRDLATLRREGFWANQKLLFSSLFEKWHFLELFSKVPLPRFGWFLWRVMSRTLCLVPHVP